MSKKSTNSVTRDNPFIKAVFDSSKRYMKKHFSDLYYTDNKEFYHYTDNNGLIGILESRGFWLSSPVFLNDREEIYNGVNLTKRLIDRIKKKKRYRNFVSILEIVSSKFDTFDYENIYIASFSLKQDALEQWRAYAKNGEGVCIGFDITKKTYYPHFRSGNLWQLYKVIYDDKLKYWILHSIIFKYYYEHKSDIENRMASDEDYAEGLSKALAMVFINFKNSAFSSEEEIRLVYNLPDVLNLFNRINYRNVNNVIVPYIITSDTKLKDTNKQKFEVDLLPISRIIVGPSIKENITLRSVENFIIKKGYDKTIVQSSSIPYRG